MADTETASNQNLLEMTRRQLLLTTLMMEGGLVCFAVFLGRWQGIHFWEDLNYGSIQVVIGIACSIPLLALVLLLHKIPIKALDQTRSDFDMVIAMFKNATVLDILVVSIMAGVCEEALFRGFLQPWIGVFVSPTGTIFLIAILFGLAHCVSRSYFVFAFLMSVALSTQLHHFDNLVVPVVTHATYDFLALFYGTRIMAHSKAT